MSTKERIVLGLLVLLVVVVGMLENHRPPAVDWSPTFSRYHKKPYGCKYVYDRLPDLFGREVTTVDRSASEQLRARAYDDEAVHTIVHVNGAFNLPRHEVELLLEQVAGGDQLFIAAWDLGMVLNDTLGLSQSRMVDRDVMTVRFLQLPEEKRPFDLTNMPMPAYFDAYPDAATVLAVNGRSGAVFLHIPWGHGDLWLCSEPRMLTNFNLLQPRNADLIATIFSFLPEGPVEWNEFRKVAVDGRMTPLRWILDQPALHWAYFLTIVLVLLYMLTHMRRQQRAIPVVAPVRNDSRDFVHTVGRLYYNKGDHADLARKMIIHFKDDVRQRAHITPFTYDNDTAERLARRTGIPRMEMISLLARIEAYEQQRTVSPLQLVELDHLLHDLRTRL